MTSADPESQIKTIETSIPPRRSRIATQLRVVVPVAAIVLLMLWIFGAFRHDVIRGGTKPAPIESADGLTTRQIAMQTIPSVTEATGTVQAEQIATISSRVVASILEMRVAAGQRVSKGETLVVLDERDLRHRVEQAQDAIRSSEATLLQAQSDYNRDKPLFDQQVITPYDFEHTQTNLKTAEANLHRLQQAEKEAEVNLSYAVISSPFSGVVVDKQANVGDLAAPGKPLLTMYEHGRLWLEANVPEELMGHIRLSETVSFRIDAIGREMHGRVVEMVPSSDPSTRTVVARVHLDETKDVVPGMFGRLLIPMKGEDVLVVPASAIIRAGQLTMVDVANQGGIQRRTVQLGRTIGDQFEVLSGLGPGEAIVLRSGSSVDPSKNDLTPVRKNP
jgi:RND family efflux transporter MFP subunit